MITFFCRFCIWSKCKIICYLFLSTQTNKLYFYNKWNNKRDNWKNQVRKSQWNWIITLVLNVLSLFYIVWPELRKKKLILFNSGNKIRSNLKTFLIKPYISFDIFCLWCSFLFPLLFYHIRERNHSILKKTYQTFVILHPNAFQNMIHFNTLSLLLFFWFTHAWNNSMLTYEWLRWLNYRFSE